MRLPAAFVALILAGSALTGCGGNSTADYCKELKADQKAFNGSGNGDIEKEFKEFHKLADNAPDEVSADWKVIDNAVSTIEKDLKDAGLKFDDLVKAQSGQAPAGVDQTKLKKVVADLSKLSDAKFNKATKAIEKHAKKECKIDLGSSS